MVFLRVGFNLKTAVVSTDFTDKNNDINKIGTIIYSPNR